MLALTNGQRVERVLGLLERGGPEAVSFLFDEPRLWPQLPLLFREAYAEQRVKLLEGALLSSRGAEAMEAALSGASTVRVALLRHLAPGHLPEADSLVAGLLERHPAWMAELLDTARNPPGPYGARSELFHIYTKASPRLRVLALEALIRPPEAAGSNGTRPLEPLETLHTLAAEIALQELCARLSEQAAPALARWLEHAAQERWRTHSSDEQVFRPPLLLAAAADCLDEAAWRAVAGALREPGPVARLLARFGRRAERAAELARTAGDQEIWVAADVEELAQQILRSPPDGLREWPAKLERLPLYQQGLVQAALVEAVAREQHWPYGKPALSAPSGRPRFNPPGPGHPVKDLLLNWIEDRLRKDLSPTATAVLCAGWAAGGTPADCLGVELIGCCP
jgi:hypothetical protein